MAALAHGLPQVIVPIAADQPENARRCEALGAGVTLEQIMVNPASARVAVWQVLDDPSYRANAERLRAEIEALPGSEETVRLLEGLVTGAAR
jgi:UDP:flavonoid glycosyltransferase YjiC (YdhE family)